MAYKPAPQQGVTLSSCLLEDLPELLKTLGQKLKSSDDAIQTVLRKSRQIGDSQHLQALLPFLGILVSHFSQAKVSSKFIHEVVKLS